MSRPSLTAEGNLVFPKRGNPPPEMEGYTRDPKNPYILLLNFPSCANRVLQQRTLPCGKRLESYSCTLGLSVSAASCLKCKERKEPGT